MHMIVWESRKVLPIGQTSEAAKGRISGDHIVKRASIDFGQEDQTQQSLWQQIGSELERTYRQGFCAEGNITWKYIAPEMSAWVAV